MEVVRFNVRVYGLLFNVKGQLLVMEECYDNKTIFKFPGGGVELGEGPIDALHRELDEELCLKQLSVSHFYTTEDFVRSAFRKNEQIISIYYKVQFQMDELMLTPEEQENGGEVGIHWLDVNSDLLEKITLPIDKTVVGLLLAHA